MAQHNLNCYSADYLNTAPKDECEEQFMEATAEVQILKVWLDEFPKMREYTKVSVFATPFGGRERISYFSSYPDACDYMNQQAGKNICWFAEGHEEMRVAL